jgi:hypothetical protein
MDSIQWYIVQAGRTIGPITGADLRERVARGRLNPFDLVWYSGLASWVQAENISGLFVGPPPPPPEPVGVTEKAQPPSSPPRRYSPGEFKELYQRVLTLSVPVAVLGAVGAVLPEEISWAAHLSAMVMLIVLSNLLLYKAWAQIQDGPARTTPGKAVGFRFIPFFHFYWEFVAVKGLAEDLNAYCRRREIPAPAVSENQATWCCALFVVGDVLVLVPYVGWLFAVPHLVLNLMLLNQVKQASMAVAERDSRGLAPTPSVLPTLDAVAKGLQLLNLGGGGVAEGSYPTAVPVQQV